MKQQTFDFWGGCIGNFFITGCLLFFNSLEAAIFQFSKLVGCPNKTNVLPIVVTGHYPVAIGVTLRNGAYIYGQCEISHPGVTAAPVVRSHSSHHGASSQLGQRKAVFEMSSSNYWDIDGNINTNANENDTS
ncbi:UNVERIFIED_CONTAM: hypothetical protein HDU68_002400, partial [Siphonaria sp. JEL0065]